MNGIYHLIRRSFKMKEWFRSKEFRQAVFTFCFSYLLTLILYGMVARGSNVFASVLLVIILATSTNIKAK